MTNCQVQRKPTVIRALDPGKTTAQEAEIGKGSQDAQHHSRRHHCIWIQNPFGADDL